MSGYSGTPLAKKLGIKSGFRLLAANAPDHYVELIGDLDQNCRWLKTGKELDFIHLFCYNSSDLKKLTQLKAQLSKTGMIWISWPKKSSQLASDINREIGLQSGLVDTKVAAIDEYWSGLKFVYRLKDR